MSLGMMFRFFLLTIGGLLLALGVLALTVAGSGSLASAPALDVATPPTDQSAHEAAVSVNSETADGGSGDGTLRRIAVPILMYHYVSVPPEDADVYRRDLSVTPTNFRAQMAFLAERGYTVIGLDDLNLALRWGAPLPPRPVVLTFDDGYADAYHVVFPILREFGYTGTFFVITRRLDEGHPAYLTWAQAREMAQAGMSIESHTSDHLDLRGRDSAFLIDQIQGSIERIEAHTGRRPRFFCYPSGRWDRGAVEALASLGIWAAVTTEGGIEHTTDAMLLLRRVRISGDTDLGTFAVLLAWEWDRSIL
jgi:peptidoglycan/xylan/chitin deacetylase (PgdA/CDA1 family)